MRVVVAIELDFPEVKDLIEAADLAAEVGRYAELFLDRNVATEIVSIVEIATPSVIDKLAEHAVSEYRAGRTRNLREAATEWGLHPEGWNDVEVF